MVSGKSQKEKIVLHKNPESTTRGSCVLIIIYLQIFVNSVVAPFEFAVFHLFKLFEVSAFVAL